jgi:hypothetical protein
VENTNNGAYYMSVSIGKQGSAAAHASCLSTYSLYNGLNLAAAMPNHFIMLWSKDYCDFLSRPGQWKTFAIHMGGYNSGSDFNIIR